MFDKEKLQKGVHVGISYGFANTLYIVEEETKKIVQVGISYGFANTESSTKFQETKSSTYWLISDKT